MAGVLARDHGRLVSATRCAGYHSLALHALRPCLDWYDTVSYTVRCRQSLAHCEQTKETRHMATRVTFPVCLAYAWCIVQMDGPDQEDGSESETVEERKLIAITGDTAVDAANTLVENYNLDPATQVLVTVLNIDAPDPIAGNAELHIPAADVSVTANPSKPE